MYECFCLHARKHTRCLSGTRRGQKAAANALEPELQKVVSWGGGGAGTGLQKSTKPSLQPLC